MSHSINTATCKQCRLCKEVCPSHLIGINEKGDTFFIPERLSLCFQCGQCMAICQTASISVEGLSYGKDIVDFLTPMPDYNQFMALLSHRRSVRNYRKKPVSEVLVKKMLEALAYAPFGAAPEKMHVTVINNREKITASLPLVEEFLDNIVNWLKNPLISFLIRKRQGTETYHTVKNHLYPIARSGNYKLARGDRITRGAPLLMIFHAEKDAEEHSNNALIYATYVMFAAASLGLGTAMNGIIPAAINKVKELAQMYEIPDGHEATIAIIAGWPLYTYQKTVHREHLNIHLFDS